MADISLRTRLKRLFSSGVVVRQTASGQLKIADTGNLRPFRRGQERYSRMYGSGMQGAYIGSSNLALAYQTQRIELFRDYDVMDSDPILASALDIYADESSVQNEFGEILQINTPNAKTKDILHNLFYDILNVEFFLWPWIRNLCKYGDFFLYLEISPEYGVTNALPMSVYETLRLEGEDPKNPYTVTFETTGATLPKQKFEAYEVAHFRLLSDANYLPYGKSELESARRIWKQIMLMEDAMMIHRIMRAPEKRIFKVDIANIPPGEVDTHMEKIISKMKKAPFVDPQTGQYNLKYNMQNITEDYFLPVRGGDSGTAIDSLKGLEFNGIEDVKYLQGKMFAALKIPKAFLGYEEAINGKLTLAAMDVRFARTIERIQRIVVSELTKIAVVHLYSQGIDDEELVNFDLSLTNPSTIYQQEKISLWKEKVDLAQSLKETKLISNDWIYEHIFELPNDDASTEKRKIVQDVKDAFRLNKIETEGTDPAKTPPAFATNHRVEPADDNDNNSGEANPVGRPEKGMTYDQDSHPSGRDPLGQKENRGAMNPYKQRESPKKSPLSLESLEMRYGLPSRLRAPVPKVITESADETQDTYLDDARLLDDSDQK